MSSPRTRAWSRLAVARRWFSPSVAVLLGVLVLFNVFAVFQAFPVNQAGDRHEQVRGDLDRRVDRVFEIAHQRASQPFGAVKDHWLFHGRNPGLFIFVAEMFIRLGAETPAPIQVWCIFLFNVGLVCFFLWTRAASNSEIFAGAATVFLLSTPFLLFHTSSIHDDAYGFSFFNLTLLFFVHYLETLKRRWLLLTLVGYFIVCQNYWMYYLSLYLMLVALQLKAGQFRVTIAALLAVPPCLAALSVLLQTAYAQGGLDVAAHQLLDILSARTGDWRIEGAEFHPERKFVYPEDRQYYPWLLAERIEAMAHVSVATLGAILVTTFVVSWRRSLHVHGWLFLVCLAGLSWNLFMFQHTVIHGFAGMYGYFWWAILVGSLAQEVYEAFRSDIANRAFAALATPLALALLSRPYLEELVIAIAHVTQ